MAATASALGRHVILSLDDMLRCRLRKATAELRDSAVALREKLSDELPFAEVAENMVLEEERLRQWLAELRQILYQADQFLDTYAADEQAERSSVLRRLPITLLFSTDKYIKQGIKTLTESMVEISKKRPATLRNNPRDTSMRKVQHGGRKLICRDNFVGTDIDGEMSTIVEKLTEDNQHYPLILFAIFGMGGVGKTTIAQRIFHDQRTRSAFSTRLWVSIYKGFVVTELVSATVHAAGYDLKGSETRSELKKLLAKEIEGRRILLVLDDIDNAVPSNENTSDAKIYENLVDILMVLRGSAEGSRVLITTDNENVANEIKSAQIHKAAGELFGVRTHRLQQLSVEDGWMLLLKTLEQENITEDLKNIGIEIVQRCNGLPLAIKAIGGVLSQRSYTPEEWSGIRDSSALSKIKDPTTATEGGVMGSIYLSYQNAPPQLKQCFLYLPLFPVDFQIEQHLATQLWISEGFIDTKTHQAFQDIAHRSDSVRQDGSRRQNNDDWIAREHDDGVSNQASDRQRNVSLAATVHEHININLSEQTRDDSTHLSQEIIEDDNRQSAKGTPCYSRHSSGHSSEGMINYACSTEETAERYFKELVGRSLLQQEHKTEGYKMHEQVRKIVESLTENEVFAGDPSDVARVSATLRHLSFVNKGLTTIPEDVGKLRGLHTLLLSGNPLSEQGLDVIFKNLQFLRVLDLSKTEISSIPKMLGNLVRLRHLNLSQTRIKALPESIGRLRRLRFLGLEKCENLTSLPKNIQKLTKLEYLNLPDIDIQDHPRLQNLSQLTFLHGFVVDKIFSNGWPLEDLKNMRNLSDLQIKIKTILDGKIASGEVLKNKDNLRNLELSCSSTHKSQPLAPEEPKKMEALFTLLHPQQYLESLKIDGYYGYAFPEWLSVHKLPSLQQLTLVNCNFCESLPPLCHLYNLKFLTIANLSKVQTMDMQQSTGEQSFPNLEELCVEDMQELESWSAFKAGDLPLLQKFNIKRCPKLKHLPGGLEHCKMLATVKVKGAELLQVLQGLFVQELLVEAMPSLSKVSNLPLLKVFTVVSCPRLEHVSGVNSLRHIHIKDEQQSHLPKWLEKHASQIETLDIVGKEELLGRCERNKGDWYIVREVARVYAYLPGRLAFFSYTRSNDFFCKYQRQRAHALEDPPAPADNRGGSVPSSSTSSGAKNASPLRPTQDHDTERRSIWIRRYMEVKFIISVVIGLILLNFTTSRRDPWETFCLLILYFTTVIALFLFL